MATIGDTVIVKPNVEGVLSGQGDIHRTGVGVVKTSTPINKWAIVVTPLYNATPHADFGLITPLAADTDFSVYRIAGIVTEAVEDVAAEQNVCIWTKGGFKRNLIDGYDTLISDAAEEALVARDIYLNDLIK